MLLLACRTTVHHPLGCIVHWKHGSHSPRQAYYRKLHQSTPEDSWKCYCRQLFGTLLQKGSKTWKKRKINRTKNASQNRWDDRMNKPAWTVEKNGKKWQMKPNPYPKAIVRHLEKPSWFETNRRKIRGHGVGMLCGCTRVSWSAKPQKLQKLRWSVWNKSPIPRFSKKLSMWNIMKHSSQEGKHRQYFSCNDMFSLHQQDLAMKTKSNWTCDCSALAVYLSKTGLQGMFLELFHNCIAERTRCCKCLQRCKINSNGMKGKCCW